MRKAVVKKALAVALIAVAMAAVSGALYERIAAARERARHPPPGSLVDVGGYRLHLHCVGSGSTVILEAGGGASSLVWGRVQGELAPFARVCTYDRAGIGWSEPSHRPPTPANASEDLRQLLERAGLAGPYVLVGHSLGGLYAQGFAFRYPDLVAGLVLVDAPHPDHALRNPPEVVRAMGRLAWMARLGSVAVRLGLARLAGWNTAEEGGGTSGAPLTAEWLTTSAAELECFQESCAQVRAAARPMSVPVIVLTHGQEDHIFPFVSEDANRAHEQLFAELQRALVRISPEGRQVVVPGIGHMIPRDAPEVVARAVRDVLDMSWQPPTPPRSAPAVPSAPTSAPFTDARRPST
jgi:pimeloyl-ACP methyl ester carboxylesterase